MATSKDFGVAIIDTNILDYAFKPRTKDCATDLLNKVARRYTLVVSEYLRFEIYRGLAVGRVASVKQLVDSFQAYAVDKATLDISAALRTCYEKDDVTKKSLSSFSDGDIILGATSFINRFVILTANRMDFPAPYFKEVDDHKYLIDQNKPLVFYELKPDISYLNAMLNVCYPKPQV